MTKPTFTRERPKFGDNPARKRNEVWAQFCWTIDENVGTNLQAFYKHFYIGCLKTQQQSHVVSGNFFFLNLIFFFFNSGRALSKLGKTVWAGRSALINMPSWNTVISTDGGIF